MSSNEDKVTVSLGAEYLYTLEFEVEDPILVPNGPNGTRAVFEFTKDTGKVYGPALNGRVVGPSSDWALVCTDGSVALDIQLLIQTEDEQIIYQKINGRAVRDGDNPSNSTISQRLNISSLTVIIVMFMLDWLLLRYAMNHSSVNREL
mmetsp:Transcript_2253/g.2882  ORF Transcript_2253/g.2882 Transcript_2253/m.2882 type:complete len:148 (+) Transcript_2253:101-544(+)